MQINLIAYFPEGAEHLGEPTVLVRPPSGFQVLFVPITLSFLRSSDQGGTRLATDGNDNSLQLIEVEVRRHCPTSST